MDRQRNPGGEQPHTSNGSPDPFGLRLDSRDRSANRIATRAASTSWWTAGAVLIAAMSNTRPIRSLLPRPTAHTTEARFAQPQYPERPIVRDAPPIALLDKGVAVEPPEARDGEHPTTASAAATTGIAARTAATVWRADQHPRRPGAPSAPTRLRKIPTPGANPSRYRSIPHGARCRTANASSAIPQPPRPRVAVGRHRDPDRGGRPLPRTATRRAGPLTGQRRTATITAAAALEPTSTQNNPAHAPPPRLMRCDPATRMSAARRAGCPRRG